MPRVLSAVALAVALAACDSSGPDVAEAGFEAEVQGAFSRSVQGEAVEDSLGGAGVMVDLGMNVPAETVTALRLGAPDADDTFYIIGTTDAALVPGTYPIERAGRRPVDVDRPRFVAFYRYRGDEVGTAVSESGTLTVTEVSEGEIAGSFEFDALVLDRDVKDDAAEPDLTVEGEFRAEMRRRPVDRR